MVHSAEQCTTINFLGAVERSMYRCIYCLILMAMTCHLLGQNMTVYHKYEDNSLMIRWKPVNASDWLNSLYAGYIVEKYEEGVLVSSSESPILAQTFDYLKLYNDSLGVPRHMVASLNHIEEVPQDLVNETFPAGEYTPDELDEARFEALNYLLNFDFGLTRFAGLGIRDTQIKPSTNYRYVIRRANMPRTDANNFGEFNFNTASYQEGDLPLLSAEWNDRRVKLIWPTGPYKQDYFGYQLSKGVGSDPVLPMDTVPIMNLYDTSALPIFQNIELQDLLENNDTLVIYQLKGYDYFGGLSTNYSEVKGKGKVDIGLSPMIYETNQLPSNEVEIKWEILDKFKDKVEEYRIYVSEAWDGPYELDTSGVDPGLRNLIRPIPFGGTYFRIAALDESKIEHSSFPQLVMAYDTLAPAIPTELEYEIDSNGVLKLQWSQNSEEDFIGYKVFMANDSLDEFSLTHYDFLPASSFVDTVDLISINEFVYYKVIAVDKRNNRSPFSDILIIEKPDILPPVEPNFIQSVPGPGMCLLQWDNSISEDVVSQTLYRRVLDRENMWTEIVSWDTDSLPSQYVDTALNENLTYAYVLTATDDAGLVSEPSEPITAEVFPDHRDVPINDFTVQKLTNQQVVEIKVNFDLQDIYQVWIYKQKDESKPRILRKIEPPLNRYQDKRISQDEQYEYFIQVIFEDGVKSIYSDTKSIE